MSLTSELSSKDSWVSRFFRNEFGCLTDFVKREGAAIRALPLKVPRGTHGQAQIVGTAFDYRLRLHFESELERSAALAHGIERMEMFGSGLGRNIDLAWAESTQELLQERPIGDELFLARASVVLAWLDAGYRSGGRWSDGMKAIAPELNQCSSPAWDLYAASVDNEVARDVAALFNVGNAYLPDDDAICGPEFAGSHAVGGADADLIVGRCLYDVKTSDDPRKRLPSHLRQLIGYILLDWDDKYALDQAGFYFSRQAKFVPWLLSKLLTECSGNAAATLAKLRDQFRRLAEENGAN